LAISIVQNFTKIASRQLTKLYSLTRTCYNIFIPEQYIEFGVDEDIIIFFVLTSNLNDITIC